MSLQLISKHRSALMAIAMLWIGIHHSYFPFDNKLLTFVLDKNGHGGIDIFMFLSAFGLYFAYKKDSNYWNFIKRRFLRILPYSIPFFIILFIAGYLNLKELFIDCLGLSIFLRNSLINWYTSMILVLYVLTPFYLKVFNKKPLLCTSAGILFIFVICLLVGKQDFYYVWFRAAVYLLGFYFAYLLDVKKDISKTAKLVLVFLMFLGWILLYLMYHHLGNDILHVYPFILITPGLLLLLSYGIEKLSFVQKPLNYIGRYTYQFYLIHLYVVGFLYHHYAELYRPGIGFDWLINIAAFVLGFIASILYKKAVDLVINSFRKN